MYLRGKSQIDFKFSLRHMKLKIQIHPPTYLSVTGEKVPKINETVLSAEIRYFGFYQIRYGCIS